MIELIIQTKESTTLNCESQTSTNKLKKMPVKMVALGYGGKAGYLGTLRKGS